MTFRQLGVGDLFRFPKYDDPYKKTEHEGAIWKKVTPSSYINVKTRRKRSGIDDPNRSVYKEEKGKLGMPK